MKTGTLNSVPSYLSKYRYPLSRNTSRSGFCKLGMTVARDTKANMFCTFSVQPDCIHILCHIVPYLYADLCCACLITRGEGIRKIPSKDWLRSYFRAGIVKPPSTSGSRVRTAIANVCCRSKSLQRSAVLLTGYWIQPVVSLQCGCRCYLGAVSAFGIACPVSPQSGVCSRCRSSYLLLTY